MCFNEAIIDVFSDYGRADIASYKEIPKWNVNHKFLERDDFDEFVEAWDSVMHLYPMFPSFQDYVPPNGVLPYALREYLRGLMKYAQSRGRRPALCEIHSRCRAGALRDTFGGFHIAQYRDPLSQFGSFFRPVAEAGEWGFLTFPLMELGISGQHPLYLLVPEPWRVPVLPWPANDRAQRWSSAMQYIAMVASPRNETIEKVFRWHLFSWVLSNLAAISYSDFALDIDKTHDDSIYRQRAIDELSSKNIGSADFSDLTKFSRYYEFDSFNVGAVCEQVISTMRQALRDGRIERAVHALASQSPRISATTAVDLLVTKIEESIMSMAANPDRRRLSDEEWKAVAEKHRKIWFNPRLRTFGQYIHPLAAPIVRAARRIRFRH